MLWNDHAAANRLEQFVVIDWLCSYHKKTLDNFDLFAEIRRHIEFNIDLATFSTGTNHGLFQSIAVFKAVLWLYEDEKSISDELQSTMNRMVNELNMQFGVEVQVENSPQYHFAISSVALSCLGLMKLVPDIIEAPAVNFDVENAMTFGMHILRPDLKLPPIGDTEERVIGDNYFGKLIAEKRKDTWAGYEPFV